MGKIFDIGVSGDSASKKRKSSGNDENEVSIFVFSLFHLIRKCNDVLILLLLVLLSYLTLRFVRFFTAENLEGQIMIFLSLTFVVMIN